MLHLWDEVDVGGAEEGVVHVEVEPGEGEGHLHGGHCGGGGREGGLGDGGGRHLHGDRDGEDAAQEEHYPGLVLEACLPILCFPVQ